MNNKSRVCTLLALALGVGMFALPASAAVVKDCILKGRVIETSHAENSGDTLVDVRFESAKAFDGSRRCVLRRGNFEFTQPIGSIMDNVSPGTEVEFRYIKDSKKEHPEWKLMRVLM